MTTLALRSVITIFTILLTAACSRWEPKNCNENWCLRGCTADGKECIKGSCGDANIDVGHEDCDDGNTSDFDGCDATCRLEYCGDGIVNNYRSDDYKEECDPAPGDNTPCGPTCQEPDCSNGLLDPNETCDDRNTISNDGCNEWCQVEYCGDNILQHPQEACDDGNSLSGDKCSADCRSIEICGNGIRDVGEECDCGKPGQPLHPNVPVLQACDGAPNSDGAGYCSDDCKLNCGDNELDRGEDCDGALGDVAFCADYSKGMGTFACKSCSGDTQPCISLRWDGKDSPHGTYEFKGMWGTSIDNLYVFGKSAPNSSDEEAIPTVLRYNKAPQRWDPVSLPNHSNATLLDLWSSPNEVFVVGESGALFHGPVGGDLRRIEICEGFPIRVCEDDDLVSVWGVMDPSLHVFALQADSDILHYDGNDQNRWTRIRGPKGSRLHDIWGRSRNAMFAVGESGAVLRLDPGANEEQQWVEVGPDVKEDFLSAWGSPEGEIFVVGASGTVFRKRADDTETNNWESMTAPTTSSLFTVWGGSSNDVFTVGRNGALLHFDGQNWAPVQPPQQSSLDGLKDGRQTTFQAIWSTPADIFVVSDDSLIYHTGRGAQ